MNKKQHSKPGFSLVEVLLAMTLVALIATPIMIQQGALLRNADRISQRAAIIQQAQNFLYETELSLALQPGITTHDAHKELHDKYESTLHFKRIPVSTQSAIKRFSNVVQDQVICSWTELNQKKQETITFFLYQLPAAQEKE